MIRLDGFHDVAIPAASGQDTGGQHADAHEHDDAAQRIGECNATEAADGGEQDDRRAEQHEAHHVRITGDRLEQLRATHELGDHGGGEEQHHDDGADVGKGIGVVAGAHDVDDGDRIEFARHKRQLLAHDAV